MRREATRSRTLYHVISSVQYFPLESAHKILKESGSIVVARLQECDGVFLNLVKEPVFPLDSAAPRTLERTLAQRLRFADANCRHEPVNS